MPKFYSRKVLDDVIDDSNIGNNSIEINNGAEAVNNQLS